MPRKHEEDVSSASEDPSKGFYGTGKITQSEKVLMDLEQEFYLDEENDIDKALIDFFEGKCSLEFLKIGDKKLHKATVKITNNPINLDEKLNKKYEDNDDCTNVFRNSELSSYSPNGIGYTHMTRGKELVDYKFLTIEDFKKDFKNSVDEFRKFYSGLEKEVMQKTLNELGYTKKEDIDSLKKVFENPVEFVKVLYMPFYINLMKKLAESNNNKKEINLSAFNTKTITLAREENGRFVRQGDIFSIDLVESSAIPIYGKWLMVRMLGSNGGYIIKKNSVLKEELKLIESYSNIDANDDTFDWKKKGKVEEIRNFVYQYGNDVVMKASRKLPKGESPICTVPAFPFDGKKHELEFRVGPYPVAEKECFPSCIIRIYTP